MIYPLLINKGFKKNRLRGKGRYGVCYTPSGDTHAGAQFLENSFDSILRKHYKDLMCKNG